ncbi:IS110 family transposase [Paludibaculum fermentans]|uniref:IS110 family transposase n=1 Tax=Paludibaculum fermentans TaxID=1473598 RepID=UPI003EBD0604
MPFAAFDLHKREIEAATFDDSGRLLLRQRFPGTREAILAFARQHLSPLHKVVMEATFNTWAVVELLQPLVHSVTVSNPLLTRAIAQAKVKTDKIDVVVLGHLLRLDYLPTVWVRLKGVWERSIHRCQHHARFRQWPPHDRVHAEVTSVSIVAFHCQGSGLPRKWPMPVSPGDRIRMPPSQVRFARSSEPLRQAD